MSRLKCSFLYIFLLFSHASGDEITVFLGNDAKSESIRWALTTRFDLAGTTVYHTEMNGWQSLCDVKIIEYKEHGLGITPQISIGYGNRENINVDFPEKTMWLYYFYSINPSRASDWEQEYKRIKKINAYIDRRETQIWNEAAEQFAKKLVEQKIVDHYDVYDTDYSTFDGMYYGWVNVTLLYDHGFRFPKKLKRIPYPENPFDKSEE